MFYLCGYNIEETALAVGVTEERARQTLNIICLGVD
jgi:hypothetical protein